MLKPLSKPPVKGEKVCYWWNGTPCIVKQVKGDYVTLISPKGRTPPTTTTHYRQLAYV